MMNYSYNDTYLADFSFRYDGSSEFGTDNKWAPFWSVGTGINVHNYAFLKGSKWINQFRIKGMWARPVNRISNLTWPGILTKYYWTIGTRRVSGPAWFIWEMRT